MSDTTITLPVHPVTGLRAIGFGRRGPIWPVLGGSGEGGESGEAGASAETGAGEATEQQQKPAETVEFWKSKSREWEKQSKANAEAAKRLAEIEDAQKSETQKAADAKAKAEAELASVPAKVADALREHLVKLHKISDEDAELFLTAADPELLIKQVTRLVGGSDKGKKNLVPREGRTPQRPSEDPERTAVRELFGS
ncbi:hypothetical protein [Nocardia farcinica]|uniref:hypothetical protein n=1 Tax=Nocardia farcinica TaxID=37329 RepID=UPI0018960552|nr:hypothetical protein [Nocardia farcinica]MBF6189432.1 hypothetical protein [Nocardia farcinica]MBF6291810.1 hypothetical protein [Nocardia farcinica]